MKILFIGCVESSRIFLKKLIQMGEVVVGVVTKKHSNFNSDFCDLSGLCTENNIAYHYSLNINDEETFQFIRSQNPDIIYCFGWSELIQSRIIELPPRGIVGYHPTKLPMNRGRHPVIWSLVLGLRQTASTFFFITEGADEGDIISQIEVNIEYEDDVSTLDKKLTEIAEEQIEEFTGQLKTGNYNRIKQEDRMSNVWRKRGFLDGQIDWRMSSFAIYNLVRALTRPFVGAHFLHGDRCVKVWKVEEVYLPNVENIEPGKVLEVYSGQSFLVKCYDRCIKIIDCEVVDIRKGEYL